MAATWTALPPAPGGKCRLNVAVAPDAREARGAGSGPPQRLAAELGAGGREGDVRGRGRAVVFQGDGEGAVRVPGGGDGTEERAGVQRARASRRAASG